MRALRLLALCAALVPCFLVGGRAASADDPRAAPPPPPKLDRKLASRLVERLRKAGVSRGRFGIAVVERDTGRVIVLEGAAEPLVPASVAKVLTAASALDHLGPAYRFRTTVEALGDVEGGVLAGDLVVRGGGDPSFEDLDPLRDLARQVRAAGIREVDGALVLDDGPLDRDFTHDDWTAEDIQRAYGAGVGGLTLGEGCVRVTVTGSSAVGGKSVAAFPLTRGAWPAVNRVKTVAGKSAALGGTWGDTGLTLRGKVPPKKSGSARIPVPDPVVFFGGAFVNVLRDEGVTVRRGLRRSRKAGPGVEVARYESRLADALRTMNVHSRNVYASTIFKLAGARVTGVGSWAGGERAVAKMAEGRGISVGGTRILDGSGLAPTSRVAAGLLAQVLLSFDRDPLRGPVMRDSLPTSGKSGTLRRRLRDRGLVGRVHAKTGTLNDVRARSLAGYIDARKGQPGVVFAIVLRGRGTTHHLIDDLVRQIDKR